MCALQARTSDAVTATAPSPAADAPLLDLDALRGAERVTQPFEYLVVRDFLRPRALHAVHEDFPEIPYAGLYPLDVLRYGPAFARLVEEIRGAALTRLMGEKFAVDLRELPLMITVRGRCSRRDGQVHTDTASKVVTALLYLNLPWTDAGGRLRVLRSAHLEDAAAEVSPNGGTLIAFRRSDRSFHGHRPFDGPRRYVMFNWMRSEAECHHELERHRRSARLKRWIPFLRH